MKPFSFGVAAPLLWTVACASGGVPTEAIAHNARGAVLLTEGRLEEAEALFRLSLEYQSSFVEPRANLGLVALRRGDLNRAERELRSALRLDEEFAQGWSNLGLVLEARGREQEAKRCYRRALDIDPGLAPPRRSLSFLLLREGALVRARAQLLRLVQLTPDDRDAQGLLAYADYRLRRFGAAKRRIESVLAAHPEARLARALRGLLRARAGDLDGAASDLEVGTDHPDLGSQFRLRLAVVELSRGRLGQARSLLAGLLRDLPGDPAVRLVAAELALIRADPARARDHARAALRLRPSWAPARTRLEQARRACKCP